MGDTSNVAKAFLEFFTIIYVWTPLGILFFVVGLVGFIATSNRTVRTGRLFFAALAVLSAVGLLWLWLPQIIYQFSK